MAMVVRFVAGLTAFKGISNNLEHLLIFNDTQALMHCIHCLFETQDSVLIKKILESKQILDFTLHALSPHDCYVINYCIVMSKVSVDLRFESCNISDDALTMLLQPIEGERNAFYYVKKLVLTNNPVVKSRLSEICKLL